MATCFFIGHRDAPEALLPALEVAVERHIVQYNVTEFIVGNRGAFDRLAARAIQNAKQRRPEIRLTLLLAYYAPHNQSVPPTGFDGSLYPDGIIGVRHNLSSIFGRQLWRPYGDDNGGLLAADCRRYGM